MEKIAKCALENFGGEAQQIIKVADDVVAQRFQFTLRWDMEQTKEPVIFDGEIDWCYQPGNDPEWIYAFNRMKFWICLGQAYAMTGDEKYAKSFANQLCHWIKTVRQDDPKCAAAWRSIEVGLRLEYWQKAMGYFTNSQHITQEVMTLYTDSITEQAEFIMGIWNSYNLMSNWGVLANHGLFMAGVLLPSKRFLDEAVRRLTLENKMQVYRDGFHWEQSPMYHNEVLHCYLDVLILAKKNNIELDAEFIAKVKSMAEFSMYSAKPDHNEICMGDSDEIDQRDLIAKGAYVFGDANMKARSCLDFDSIWDIGFEGILEYESLDSSQPAHTDKACHDSGNYYFRSGWGENDTFLHFHCGTLGAGHGHADQLHLDLFSRGDDILVDSGRFSYVFDGGRNTFKKQSAHNTTMVDGREIYRQKDSWECYDLLRTVNQKFYSDEKYGYCEGGHLAYMNPEGVFTNRRVIYLKPDIVFICDEFYANREHTYQQFWHFGNVNLPTRSVGNSFEYLGENSKTQIEFIGKNIISMIDFCEISRKYNDREHSSMITTLCENCGFTSMYSVFAMSDKNSGKPLKITKNEVKSNFKNITFSDSQIESFTIEFADEKYTLVIAHEEYASPTDTFLTDGCVGFGNVVVFDRGKQETEIGRVLLY